MSAPGDKRPGECSVAGCWLDWRPAHRRLLVAMAASAAVCLLWGAFRFRHFPLDDAYIHLSYGKYFRWGHLPSFNGDGPDTGSSSWLWTALCIAIEQAHLPAVPSLTTIEVLLLGAMVYQLMSLTAQLVPPAAPIAWLWPYLSAALLLTDGNLMWLALSGMEATLLCALMLAYCRRLFAHPERGPGLGLLALALVFTRLEAAAWVLLALLLSRLQPAARRPRLRWWLLPATGAAAQLGYNVAVGGGLLPTTAAGKTATYVPSDPSLAAGWHFIYASWRDYLRPHVSSWAVLLLIFAAAAAVALAAILRAARRHTLRRRLAAATVAEHATALIVLGTLAHAGVYLLFFRTSYHHFRYFTPLLVVSIGLAAPLGVRAAMHLLAPLGARMGSRWRRARAAASVSAVATGAALLLWQGVRECRYWQRLLVLNTAQLERVHIAAGRWLAANRHELARPVVAGFDIGALRYFSGMRVVDLGGLLERRTAGPGWREANSALVAREHVAVVASLDNGFDRLPTHSWRHGFDLAPLWGFAFREYHDPFPPHSKIIRLLRVNHCGEPRRRLLRMGTVLAFDSASGWHRRLWGHGSGSSFAHWPTLGRVAKPKLYRRIGQGYLSSYHPELGGGATGRWESVEMGVVGDFLSFFIAGGARHGLGVEIVSSSGATIARFGGYGMPVFVQERVSLAGHRGERLRVRVIDDSTRRDGYLAIDDVHQYRWVSSPPRPCR